MKKNVLRLLALCFAVLLAYSGYRVWGIGANYRDEAEMHGAVLEFKPEPDSTDGQGLTDLRAKYPDAVGWLTVPDTGIDYPFVWYGDNDHYLRRDLNGEHATAGTLFMDFRCKRDFSSGNTIIYGHNMKNGSMFGTLKSFADKAFFDGAPTGTICLPHRTITLEFFAYLIVKSNDPEIYSADPDGACLDYIRQNARQYRDIGVTAGDRIVTLSTCSREFDDARGVLVARVGAGQ